MEARIASLLLESQPRIKTKVGRRLGDGALEKKCTNMPFAGAACRCMYCVRKEPGEGEWFQGWRGHVLSGENRDVRSSFCHVQVQCPVRVPVQPLPSASTQTTVLQCPQNHRSPDRFLAERPKEGIEGKGLCKPSGVTQSSQAKL